MVLRDLRAGRQLVSAGRFAGTGRVVDCCRRGAPTTSIEQIVIGANPAAWARAGFALKSGTTKAGSVALHFERARA